MRKRNIFKQRRVPYLGALIDSLYSTLPLMSIYSGITITILLYASVKDYLLSLFPWMRLWIFVVIILISTLPILLLVYKFIIPSLWSFRSSQMSHLEDKLNLLLANKDNNDNASRNKVVAVSGGFDPIHPGHIAYIEEASRLGGKLIVILTRDDQLIEKDRLVGGVKNRAPIPYEVRKQVIEWGLKGRGEVVENVDKDITSCESLRKYKPDIFAKGGNTWDYNNLPEKEICDQLGIKVIFGIGGYNKLYSSSQLGRGTK